MFPAFAEIKRNVIRLSLPHTKKILHLTLFFLIFIVSIVLALADAQLLVPTAAGVVNIEFLAAVDIDPDVLNEADKLGLGSFAARPKYAAGQNPIPSPKFLS